MTIEEKQTKLENAYYDALQKKLEDANVDNAQFIISLVKHEQWNMFDLQQRLCRLSDIDIVLSEKAEEIGDNLTLTENEIDYVLEAYEDSESENDSWSHKLAYIIDKTLGLN